jgi:hypothetical protein
VRPSPAAIAPAGERTPWLRRLAVPPFRTALLLRESEPFPYGESYFTLGLTSLGAVEIEQYLCSALGRPLDAATILNRPTIDHLLSYLRADVLAEFFPASGPGEPGGAAGGEGAAVVKAILGDLLGQLYQA